MMHQITAAFTSERFKEDTSYLDYHEDQLRIGPPVALQATKPKIEKSLSIFSNEASATHWVANLVNTSAFAMLGADHLRPLYARPAGISLCERRRLIELVRLFGDTADASLGISDETAAAGCAFFRLLPNWVAAPRISPDGEGGLMIVWGTDGDVGLLLTLDSWIAHLVESPGTEFARYQENIPVQPDGLPAELLELFSRMV